MGAIRALKLRSRFSQLANFKLILELKLKKPTFFYFIAIGDVITTEYLSKLMPNDLITMRSGTDDLREVQKKLMDPSEILSDKGIIVFLSKLDRPARFERRPYYEIPAMLGMADERPML